MGDFRICVPSVSKQLRHRRCVMNWKTFVDSSDPISGMLSPFGNFHKSVIRKSLVNENFGTKEKSFSDCRCDLYGHTRYLILLLALLCMSIVRCNEMLFNLTVICMSTNDTFVGVSLLVVCGQLSNVSSTHARYGSRLALF